MNEISIEYYGVVDSITPTAKAVGFLSWRIVKKYKFDVSEHFDRQGFMADFTNDFKRAGDTHE